MIKKIILTIAVFLGIDFIWLGIVATNFYNQQLAAFERTIRWFPAILVYLLIPLGIVFLVLPKSKKNIKQSFFWGAIYGLIVYGVYDLTNYATLKKWSLTVVVVDLFWGMFICALTSVIIVSILNRKK